MVVCAKKIGFKIQDEKPSLGEVASVSMNLRLAFVAEMSEW